MTTNPAYLPAHPFSPLMRQHNNRSPGLSTGSATQTLTNTPQRSESPEPLILRLRGAHTPQSDSASDGAEGSTSRRRPHIKWAEDVIDNEGLGRKKSKVCCIYHKPRPVGESSDESSSDSSSSDSDDSDFGGGRDGARPVGGRKGAGRGRKGHGHDHEHGDGCGHGHGEEKNVKKARRPSPNAYEKMPKYDVKPLTAQPRAAS